MQGRSKWLFTALIPLWLMSCSHGPETKATPQPAQATAPQVAAQGVPKAEIPEKEFNFGVMAEDGTYVHEFKILNKGTGILEVNSVMAA